ncbi:hypothetical protein [Ornithinimicrobium flavum]|nr:hypothetical protein [Ornithinimicrobium flavum]
MGATDATGGGIRAGLLVGSALAAGLVVLSLLVRRPEHTSYPSP